MNNLIKKGVKTSSVTLYNSKITIGSEMMDMFTPSEIVYSAWEKTKKPLLYNTSDGKKA